MGYLYIFDNFILANCWLVKTGITIIGMPLPMSILNFITWDKSNTTLCWIFIIIIMVIEKIIFNLKIINAYYLIGGFKSLSIECL